MESLHGREVIDFISKAQPPLAQDKLIKSITTEFGDVLFHVCSRSQLTIRDLIDFLVQRDKLYFVNGRALINKQNLCRTGEE